MNRYAQSPRLLSKTVRQNPRTLVTRHVTYNADNKRAQSPSRRRGATAILRLVRGLTSARARSGIPRRSGNIYRPILFSNDTTVVEMAYDYMGRRYDYKETVNNTLTRHERYLYRGYLQLAALDMLISASVKHTIAWDPCERVATRPLALQIGATAYYYSFDQVKNVTELFDSAGTIAATYDYSPFGQQVTSTGNIANPLTFSSEIHDSTLGLQYYNYRHLNLLDGRWLNRDPISEWGGDNIYSFIANETHEVVDLLGLKLEIPLSKKLCGKWIIREQSVPIHVSEHQRLLGNPAPGFETEFVPDTECACEGDIKIIQSIEKSGFFSGLSPYFDMYNSNYKEQERLGNVLPLGYVEAGGPEGTHGKYSYRDAPYDSSRVVRLATAQKDGNRDSTFTISVCAVCCKDNKYQNLGCANFKWLDVKRKIVWKDSKAREESDGSEKPSEKPGSTWDSALKRWNAITK